MATDKYTICIAADGRGNKAHAEVASHLVLGALAASGSEFDRSLETALASSRREVLTLPGTIAHSLLPSDCFNKSGSESLASWLGRFWSQRLKG